MIDRLQRKPLAAGLVQKHRTSSAVLRSSIRSVPFGTTFDAQGAHYCMEKHIHSGVLSLRYKNITLPKVKKKKRFALGVTAAGEQCTVECMLLCTSTYDMERTCLHERVHAGPGSAVSCMLLITRCTYVPLSYVYVHAYLHGHGSARTMHCTQVSDAGKFKRR